MRLRSLLLGPVLALVPACGSRTGLGLIGNTPPATDDATVGAGPIEAGLSLGGEESSSSGGSSSDSMSSAGSSGGGGFAEGSGSSSGSSASGSGGSSGSSSGAMSDGGDSGDGPDDRSASPRDAGCCRPKTCADYPAGTCGEQGDGCGHLTPNCGTCVGPQSCGGGGEPSLCGANPPGGFPYGCTPITCAAIGSCGPAADGCGGVLTCSTCVPAAYCSEGVPDAGSTPRLVLYGGFASGSTESVLDAPLGDTWTFDGARWTRFNGVGPTARYGHAMATLGNVVVMFGGLVLTTHFGEVGAGNDTWTFDGAEWRQVPGIGPPPRWRASMATLGNKVVLFGGTLFAGSPVYDDTWTFDGTRWTQVKGAGPPARYSAAMTAVGNQVVLFGGSPISPNGSNPPFFADTWTFDGASWTQRGLDAGSSPHARYGLAMATLGSRAVLFSGVYDVFFRLAFLDDLWTFDASGWGMVAFDASAGPLPRAYPSVASYGARVVLFGGTYLGTMNDLWSYDGTSWTQVNATGPSARAVSAMATLIR